MLIFTDRVILDFFFFFFYIFRKDTSIQVHIQGLKLAGKVTECI